MDPWPAAALSALLDLPEPAAQAGDPLPPLWQWFHPAPARPARTGPRRPPARRPLPAAHPRPAAHVRGRPLRVTEPILWRELASRSSLAEVTSSTAAPANWPSSPCATSSAWPGPVGVEEQDIVYRSAAGRRRARPPSTTAAPGPAPRTRLAPRLPPDPMLLFRFSALTYNGHRIHYDALRHRRRGLPRPRRARPAAGPAGAGAAPPAAPTGAVTEFAYRLVRPAFAGAVIEATARRTALIWTWPSAPSRPARPSPQPRRSRSAMTSEGTMTDATACAPAPARCAPVPRRVLARDRPEPPLPPGVRRHAHRRRAARRAHPHRVRRPRAQPHRGRRDHGGDQQVGRALRRLPRPDVHHGRGAAARQRPAEERRTCR